ncbi:MAG TPA: hypothetical protein VHZ30_02990 [Verrucomicrobiae bacterium]|jgi:hypothetical protein|nr:hypothetical protein [Verrucomicrobiae bacterium]
MNIKPSKPEQARFADVEINAQCGGEITPKRPPTRESLVDPMTAPIMAAVTKAWPNAAADYQNTIFRRFTELHKELPVEDAIKAIRAGYSSPGAAMRAGVIHKRSYQGFKP